MTCADRKRADWLKFCHDCGKDISTSARGQVRCEGCRPLSHRDDWTQSWKWRVSERQAAYRKNRKLSTAHWIRVMERRIKKVAARKT